ncbi:MAG: aspartate aminotransferase family protein [Myxococcota bacterium]
MSEFGDAIYAKYQDWARISGQLIAEARAVFPGGDTRASAHFAPYPVFVERAAGQHLYDADGHQILDFMNNFTSLIHGHADPRVVDALKSQAELGSAYAAPTTSQVSLGALIRERVPSVEQLRFTSSGTEATQMALRCARAVTGRQKVMKMEGGYHGSYEMAEVSMVPLPGQCGPIEAPHAVPVDKSVPESVLRDTVVCPYNRPEHARSLIREHAHELAAVIVEPVLGSLGMIPASADFLRALREETAQHGVILIFDEVITLRVHLGGAQAHHGITPDLTAMGKIIGGGLPIGAVGGRADLMQVFHPDESPPVMHSSTFSGNPLSMAAGFAAMRPLDAAEIDRINQLGEAFRQGANDAFARHGIRGQAVGMGSLSNLHFSDTPLQDSRDSLHAMIGAGEVGTWLHLSMLQRGVMSASRLMYAVSTPMGDADVAFALAALDDVLTELRPGIERERPSLRRD